MNIPLAILGLVVLVLLGGGTYFYSVNSESADNSAPEMVKDSPIQQALEVKEMMEKKDAMVKEEMQKDEMNTEEDSVIKNEGETEMDKGGGAMIARGGTYEAYAPEKIAWAKNGKVVLFFRAGWCPTCKAVDADIRSKLSSIPKDVTILDVNYDAETALKQKYGVTYQHTFVQVDGSGNSIVKWSGSATLAALLSNVR